MQVHNTQTPSLSHPRARQNPTVRSGFNRDFAADLAEAGHKGPLDSSKTQALERNADKAGLIELGTITANKPTVSHLLIDYAHHGPDCWEIVHSEINADKPYTRIPAGTRVFLEPDSKEIIWEGPERDSSLQGLTPAAGSEAPEPLQTRIADEPLHLPDSSLSPRTFGLGETSSLSQNREQALIERAVDLAAARYELPRELISGVIKAESDYQPRAVSPAGAQGLMQLMPETARELGVDNPFDIQENIDGGSRYLKKMLRLFDGDVTQALAAYNAGPGTMQKHRGQIPFQETRLYVQRVLSFLQNRENDFT
ncbi:MAG: lytic transglycosylase domain-containing protein [Desulfohalobiaceae bacterium]|nr:lytic transglycosylase domain-containing protein [Desulfohalobiaceae bacterium]